MMSDVPNSMPNEKDLLLATIDLPTEERHGYLENACGGNADLLRRVQQLLDHADASGSFMALPAIDLRGTTPFREVGVGTQIDRYRLLEQLGEGGMGVVFVAEQTEPVRRKVALKIIKPGMDSKAVIARFEAERQALALMDHPHIARVLDGGTTSGRLPYFVMELVRGMPITKYCDQAKASLAVRLSLFIDVCNAVQHAHQKGIIHRDLKPSNILVTLHDGKPVVKVIDFGVAKALNQPLTEQTVYTAFNQMMGTPLYMSPEQFELSGLDIDTRSDVYSLGVLLYELLCGETPFDRERLLKSGFDEMRRIVREEEPPRPSFRMTTLPQAQLSTTAEHRSLDQRTLQNSLKSELDWIALKALEKDRNRRYNSAADFAADVQRYLANEAVEACPPSFSYRMRKTIARNRLLLTTTSAIGVALIVGLLGTTWQWRRALLAQQEQRAAAQLAEERAELANHRLQIAEKTIDVFYTEFSQEWLGNEAGFTERQKTFLQKAVEAYEQLAGEGAGDAAPREGAVRAHLRAGQLFSALGNQDLAVKKLTLARKMATEAKKSSNNSTEWRLLEAQSSISLAFIHRDRREHSQKLSLVDMALPTFRDLLVDSTLTLDQEIAVSEGLSACAKIYSSDKARKQEATEAADKGLLLIRQLAASNPADQDLLLRLANSLSAKGQQLLWWGTDNEACAMLYAESIAIKRRLIAENPELLEPLLSLPITMQNYDVALQRLGRSEELARNHIERLEVTRRLVVRFPERPALQVLLGEALRMAGNYEAKAGRTDEAWKFWRECTRQLIATYEKFPDVRQARLSLVRAFRQFGHDQRKAGKLVVARKTLSRCNDYLIDFERRFPGDSDMYVIRNQILRELAIVDLLSKDHAAAFTSAKGMLENEKVSIENQQLNASYLYDFQEHLGQAFVGTIARLTSENCSTMAQSETSSLESNASAIVEYNQFRTVCAEWIKARADGWRGREPDIADEWSELSKRIDAGNGWKHHHRSRSATTLTEDAQVDTQAFLLQDHLRAINSAQELPSHWADVVIVAASSPHFCETPELLLRLCERGLEGRALPNDARRSQIWALFRCKRYEECLSMLDECGGTDDEVIRCLTHYQLGQIDLAREAYNRATQYMADSEQLLTERLKRQPFAMQPNIETLRRLRAEVEVLLASSPESTIAEGATAVAP